MIGEFRGEISTALPGALTVAHELKSPLALMRQLSLLVRDTSAELTPTEVARYQDQIALVAERSLDLVSDMTQLPSLNDSLFPLEPVNPLAVCEQLARDMEPMARLYGRIIEWPRRSKKALVVANMTLLERIVANFVHNAVRYTDETVPIAVRITQSDTSVRLSVRDYGPTMNLGEYRRLVGELSCVKSSRSRADSSGLGVFIASEFAQAMNAEIGVIRHRRGVSFYVDMPMSRQMSLL